jgi:hypothetical protein
MRKQKEEKMKRDDPFIRKPFLGCIQAHISHNIAQKKKNNKLSVGGLLLSYLLDAVGEIALNQLSTLFFSFLRANSFFLSFSGCLSFLLPSCQPASPIRTILQANSRFL